MSKRSLRLTLGAAVAVTSLVLGSAAAAHAILTPDNGPVAGGTTVTVAAPSMTFNALFGGSAHSSALGSDGHTYAWGNNEDGRLGNGTHDSSSLPMKVSVPAGVTFTAIAGRSHSLALGSDGNAYAWGNNSAGQLGNGSTTDSTFPVQVQAPAGVTFTAISGGVFHSLALGSDGNAYAWGNNSAGQLGNGSTTDSTFPVQVQAPAGVTFTAISGGGRHSLALGSDGNAYAWGNNYFGQLGDGSTTDSTFPLQVQAPAGVTFTAISSGGDESLALGIDGNAYAWGNNYFGQLGDGSTTDSTFPVQVQAPAGITFTAISGGGGFSLAVGSDGNAYAWGNNSVGQLGDGSTTDSTFPVQVLADVTLTEVTFDGSAGSNLVDNGDGTWSVETPPHAAGPVEVVVSWMWNGIAQVPISFAGGFTYNLAPVVPTITNPADQMVASGDTALFTVAVSGTPAPNVAWEVSREGDSTWEMVSADPAATPAANGLTLSVIGTSTNDGYIYRATATNSAGEATSQGAKLTVTSEVSADKPKQESDKTVNTELAFTGSSSTSVFLIVALVALLLGTILLASNHAAKRRMNR